MLPGTQGVEQVALVVGSAVPLEVRIQGVVGSDEAEVGVLVLLEGVGPARLRSREGGVSRDIRILVHQELYILGALLPGRRGEVSQLGVCGH